MSSRTERSEGGRGSLGLRLTVWFAGLFLAGGAAVLAAAYLTLATSLRQRDRLEIEAELQDLQGAYNEHGVAGLREDARQASAGPLCFIRLRAPDGKTAFQLLPAPLAAFDLSRLPASAPTPVWTRIASPRDEEALEVASRRLSDGTLLQVGQSTAAREDVLERFRWIAAAVFLPTAALSALLGFVLARRALRPVRHLIEAVEEVLAGRSGSRVPAGGGEDELERLSVLFNRMLERIEGLIAAMKGSLDEVAHDLRTPIARLRAQAEDALRRDAGLPTCREALADCVEECDRLASMLTTLMDISEAESGTLALNRAPADLDALVDEAAELYRYAAEEKGVRLEVVARAGARALCDRNRLRQVVANLLDNAVKYTPAGGRVELATSVRGPEAAVTVRDTGDGISPEDLPRIWERLYRGRGAKERRGLGLGLSLVRAVVQAHGGRVEAANAAEGGAMFRVSLPALADPAGLTKA